MTLKKNNFAHILFVLLPLVFTSCTAIMGGKVKDDVSLTEQGKKLESVGADYTGPEYTIGIKTLQNETPSKVLGLAKAATTILVTLLKDAHLMPIKLSKEDKAIINEWAEDQQTGMVGVGKKDAATPSDSIDFIFMGAVTSYSELEEGSDYLFVSTKTQIVKVGVDYRLVDMANNRTLVAKSGLGEYSKTTRRFLGGFGSSSSTDNTLRDGALRDAMSKAVEKMIAELSKRPFTGKVLAMDGSTVIFKAGTRSKLNSGDRLGVYRLGKKLIDPDTGRVLGRSEKKIGEVTLVSHQNEKVSQGSVSSGSGFRVGDLLKVIK